jgi:hypothetical protein
LRAGLPDYDSNPSQHATVIGTVIAVMEQRDVPGVANPFEKLHQRSRPFRKLEPQQDFVAKHAGAPAHHVPHVQLGGFVGADIDHLIAGVRQTGDDPVLLPMRVLELEADENMRIATVRKSIVELGNDATAEKLDKAAIAAAPFGNSDTKEDLARASPISARSATWRNRSKFILAPLLIAISAPRLCGFRAA